MEFSLATLFLYFIIYAFLGWVIEVVFHIYTLKKVVNRGFLFGPVCPIYGCGAIIMILLLYSFEANPILVFFIGAAAASVLEYITGYVLERVFQTRWWDYSEMKYNIKGYVSLSFTILWGIASVFLMEILHPFIKRQVGKVPLSVLNIATPVLFVIFVTDLIFTIMSLIEFRDIIMAANEAKEKVAIKKQEFELSLNGLVGVAKEELDKKRQDFETQLKLFSDEILDNKLANRRFKFRGDHRRFLKSYPSLTNSEIAKKIKSSLKR